MSSRECSSSPVSISACVSVGVPFRRAGLELTCAAIEASYWEQMVRLPGIRPSSDLIVPPDLNDGHSYEELDGDYVVYEDEGAVKEE